MFCENIFFRSLVQSYSYIIMKLYPLYIVHISPPHSRPFQHQHRKPAPLLCHCAFLYLGVLPDQNLCQEPTPQVSPSLTKVGFNIVLFLNEQKPFGRTLFQGICCEDSAADIRRKSCRGKGVSMATEEKKHLKSGANSMIFNVIFNSMIFNNMIFNYMIFNNMIFNNMIFNNMM